MRTPRLLLACLLLLAGNCARADAAAGEALYAAHCGGCHANPALHAPSLEAMQRMPLSRLLTAMEFGKMQAQAATIEPAQRRALAEWLAAADDAERDAWIARHACPSVPALGTLDGTENYGAGIRNTRHRAQAVEIAPADVPRLQLAWSLALPQVTDMRSQPVAAGDTLFLGTQNGNLLALATDSGCVRWHFPARGAIRSALTLASTSDGVPTLFFADDLATVYAVDARRGTLRWTRPARLFPTSVISGSTSFHADRLYVPVSSFEVAVAGLPTHPCCRSHGAVMALDARDGSVAWTYHTTADAQPTTRSAAGVQLWGPSGASVWSTPTIDAARGLLYVGSGENFSLPATDTSDAVLALELGSGRLRWRFQALAGDVWNAACQLGGPNCPPAPGPDWDIGASVVLARSADGRERLLVGQKSGEVFALDPDAGGAVLWRKRLSQGTANGGNSGVHWGMASDGETVYVPISDPDWKRAGYTPRPGVYALRVADGSPVWSHPVTRDCAFDPADAPLAGLAQMRRGDARSRSPWPDCPYFYAHSAPALLANGVVWAGALDGRLRAIDARDGRLLGEFQTRRAFRASNGIEGHGGSIDVVGAVPQGRRLFVVSGYSLFGQMPGNVLLAWQLPESPIDEDARP